MSAYKWFKASQSNQIARQRRDEVDPRGVGLKTGTAIAIGTFLTGMPLLWRHEKQRDLGRGGSR